VVVNVPSRTLVPKPQNHSIDQNLHGLPWVVDPGVTNGDGGDVTALVHHVLGELALLRLVLVVEHEDRELRGLGTPASLLCRLGDILLQLLDGVLEGSPGVVDLVHDQNVLADQVGHLETAKVQPLCPGNLGARLLDLGVGTERLVQRKANSLDGNVRAAGGLEERSENARGDVATTADGDHEVRLALIENARPGLLAQLVHLWNISASLTFAEFPIKHEARASRLGLESMGNTYIVVSHVNLLDHVCGFATLRLWVGGCFDLTSSAGVLT
jgi:hypothetical protein